MSSVFEISFNDIYYLIFEKKTLAREFNIIKLDKYLMFNNLLNLFKIWMSNIEIFDI